MSTNKTLSLHRRNFLRGAGATLALPFLESLRPAKTYAQSASAPTRMFAFYVPNGIHMADFTPTQAGSTYALPAILSSLAPHRADVLVLSGLDNEPATAQGDGNGDHARGTSAFLTCAHPVKTEGANLFVGPSMDQLVADHYSGQTRLRSLELGCEGGGSTGGCDSGYSCAYTRNISWRTASTPMAKEISPRSVFDRLFAGMSPDETLAQTRRRRLYRQSILDYVREDATTLQARVGLRDRQKLEEYLTGVRELEIRIDALTEAPGNQCRATEAPTETPADFERYVQSMLDLVVLAFRCDLTRVATFMLGNGSSNRSFGFLGVSGSHHELSHHQGDPAKHAALRTINTWEVAQFAYLIERLKQVEETDGSNLLDHSLLLFSSEVADGNSHGHANLPVLLAGHGGGEIVSGRHVQFSGNVPLANLYLSMMQTIGVDVDRFGDDGTNRLNALFA